MKEPSALPSRLGHFPCIDGYRALAALAVVAFHVTGELGLHRRGSGGGYTSLLGTCGVAAFFVISGFLLYRPYVAAHLDGRPLPIGWRTFYRRRVLRIFPAYWVALAVDAYVLRVIRLRGLTDTLLFFGLLHTYKRGRVLGGLGISWTLCIEISFYAALPLIASGIGRLVSRPQSLPARIGVELTVLMGMAILGSGYRLVALFVLHGRSAPMMSWLPAYLDWFAIGMAFALASAAADRQRRLPPVVRFLGQNPLVCLLLAGELVWMTTLLRLPRGFASPSAAQLFWSHLLVGAFAGLLLLPGVVGDQGAGAFRSFLRSPGMVWLGTISYGIFLWHRVWLSFALRTSHYSGAGLAWAQLFFPVIVLTLVTAWLSFVLIEAPLMRHRATRRRLDRETQIDGMVEVAP